MSENIVNSILIIGLIVGTLGVLCLAYGFLGKTGQQGFRGLLLIVGVSALFALVLVELALFAGRDSDVPKVLVGSAIYGVFFTGALGRDTEATESWWGDFGGVVLGAVSVGVLASVVGIVYRSAMWENIVRAGGFIAVAVLVVCTLRMILIRRPERHLRIIGILLTLLGIASQVMALTLDILNVKIV